MAKGFLGILLEEVGKFNREAVVQLTGMKRPKKKDKPTRVSNSYHDQRKYYSNVKHIHIHKK